MVFRGQYGLSVVVGKTGIKNYFVIFKVTG